MKTITIIITLLMCGAAQARLGETVNECMSRYGEPLSVDKETMTLGFQKEDIFIMCVFHEGKCAEIAYKKHEGEFSDVEAEVLRAANGKDWTPKPTSDIDQTAWENETSYAVTTTIESMVIIMTKDQKTRRDAARAAKEKEKLKGF